LVSFIDPLRRTNVEGTTIEKTADQKSASVGLAETDEKMKVLSGLLRRNQRSSCSVNILGRMNNGGVGNSRQ
jgi:hypothetical protein